MRPRTGSIDLALGVGVGLCLGAAAVFVIFMTRLRRAPRHHPWRGQGQQAAPGFGYDGVRLHGGGGSGAAGGVSRWPHRRKGFPGRGGKAKAGPKEVAIELGRVGFDYDGNEARDFDELSLRDGSSSQVFGQDDAREMSRPGLGGGSDSALVNSPRRAAPGVHRSLDCTAGAGLGTGLGLAQTKGLGGRGEERFLSPLREEVVVDKRLEGSSEGEQDALLSGFSS